MGYPAYPAAAEHRPRPTTVTVSTYLLWVTAAVQLITGAITVSSIGPTMQVYRDVYAGTELEGSEAFLVGITIIGIVINVIFAVVLVVLAVFNNRGRNGARITTWVLGGISLCCSGAGVAGTALTSSMNLDSRAGGPSTEELEARLADVLPGWYEPVTIGLAVISVLAMLGAIILLALPASNAYFRKAQPAWDPSSPYPYPYPGQQPSYPGQPAYPGQPQAYPPYPAQEQSPQGYQPPESTTPPPPSTPPSSAPPGGGTPHTGSVPPTDPWSAPPPDRPADRPTSGDDKPPSGPAAQG